MTKFALKNPVSVIVLAALLFITGMVSFGGLKRESFPEIKIPYIYVTTVYSGANPPEVENLITQKIEDKLDGIDGVKQMTSSSNESYSTIFLEFQPTVQVEDALRRVKDKVDQAKSDLPLDAEEPITQELNFSTIPVANIAFYADYDMERLESLVNNLKDRMEKIPGVLEAKVLGKQEKEIAVDVDPALLREYGLTLSDISKAITNQHTNVPGGTMITSGYRFSIKITGELTDPDQFNDLIVRSVNDRMIRIKDVAKVSFTYTRDRQTISRTNGRPSLTLTVAKRTGEDIVRIVDEAKKVIAEDQQHWPAGTHYEVFYDMSKNIRQMVSELENHLLMGILLVLLVLSFFLGVRNSLFISTAIPFSMSIGFIVLSQLDVTLNMVVLFSLVMVLGMLVDDGIVVVENIYRHLGMGKSRHQAALDGTREVMVPVFTATLTTVAAFTPVLFMPGVMGEFLKYLPETVGITLSGSLFVAFIFNPVFASLTMSNKEAHKLDGEEKGWFERFKEFYRNVLRRSLKHPWILAAFCLAFVLSGIFAYFKFGPGVVFFPVIEPDVASVQIEGPLSQDIAITDAMIRKPESVVLSMPPRVASVKTVNTIVGSGKTSRMVSSAQAESNKGYLDIVFKDFEERDVSSYKTMKWLEDTLRGIVPGWKLQVIKQAMGPPTGKAVELEIGGDDYAQLSLLADSIMAVIRTVPGLTNVTTDYDPARPEIRVNVDREQAKRMGFSTLDVASAVRGSIYGYEAAKYRVGKDEYKIMVRLAPDVRENLNGLNEIVISKDGKEAPLSSVATIAQGANIASIKHIDGKRSIQVTAELAPGQKDERGPKAMAVAAVRKIRAPAGYSVRPGSGNRMQAESSSFLVKAFFVAMGLVFLTMVFQFNSLYQPFLILIGIFLSLGGVFWGLLITNKFSAFVNLITAGRADMRDVTFAILMSGVGIIALAGVVAKNGIVLIDFMNRLKKSGRPLHEAVVEGGATRLRPVLLTAITAMIGLLPLATGYGIDFLHLGFMSRSATTQWWAPMAWAIFWGLLFNTLLVLIVTPTFYYTWENWRAKVKSRKLAKS
ncbi:MAG TPA: efflux RND transporter permease subunit [Chitinivibrionales bacterium]|nr:efflux RND transporter permease subunit [Chitinivibrionales bacterium]